MLRKARERAREKNPEAILTSECNAECFMAYLDAFLTWHSFQGELVPIFPAVYGGWTITFGRSFTMEDLKNPISFRAKVGQMFIFGAQLGWFNLYEITQDEYKAEAEYLKKLAKYRLLGLKFLLHGRLMRPLKFDTSFPTIDLNWTFIQKTVKVTLPVVMSSVWKADDGTLGIIFTNISETPQLVAFKIDLKDYGFPQGKKYTVSRITEKGKEKIDEYGSTEIQFKDLLPGRDVLMLQIEAN